MWFLTVRNEKLVCTTREGSDLLEVNGPDFEALWKFLRQHSGVYIECTELLMEEQNARFLALVDGADADWTADADDPEVQHAQFLGFTCKVARKAEDRWTAWASRNSGVRVIDERDRTHATEVAARAAALRLAYEDTFRPAAS